MRRIILALLSTVAAVILLFGYRTSSAQPVSTAAPTATATGAAGSGGNDGAATGTTTSPAPAASPSSAGTTPSVTKTVVGDTVGTRWGPVQVRITVSGSKVTAVDVLQVPSGNGKDDEINGYAVPILRQEALQAQSASIDTVGGATITSDGYVTSLQSALDKAGL